jgi:hypothetical protein
MQLKQQAERLKSQVYNIGVKCFGKKVERDYTELDVGNWELLPFI